MSNSRIIKNIFILFSQSVLALVISVFVNGYIARKLGTEEYGKFVFAFSFASIFAIFSDMGLHGWGVKQIASTKEQTAALLGDIIVIRSVFSLLTFLIVCAAISLLDYPEITRNAVYIAAASVILVTIQFTNVWIVFEAHEAVKYEGISNVACRIAVAIMSVYLMYFDYGIIALSWAYLAGCGLQIFYCHWILRKKFCRPIFLFSIRKYLVQVRQALPFAFLSFFFVIYYEIDKNMLSMMKGDTSVGLYNAAATVAYRAAIISSAVSVACMPSMIRFFKQSSDRLAHFINKVIPLLLLLGLPIAVCGTVYAKAIIDFIYRSSAYHPSILTLQIIVWMIPLEFLSHFFRFALIASEQEKMPAYIVGIGVGVNLILNGFLISMYSYNGAALATVVTEVFLVGAMITYYHYRIAPIRISRRSFGVMTINVPFYFFLDYLIGCGWGFAALLVALPGYLGMLVALKIIDKEYMLLLMDIVRKKGIVEK